MVVLVTIQRVRFPQQTLSNVGTGMRVRRLTTFITIAAMIWLCMASPAQALVSDTPAGDGTYKCSIIGTFTVENGEVTQSSGCTGSVVIPYGVTAINDDAFKDATGLTAATFSEGVLSIGNSAFKGSSVTKFAFLGSAPDFVALDAFSNIGVAPQVFVVTGNTDFGGNGNTWNGLQVVEVGGTYQCVTAGVVTGSGTFTVTDMTVTRSNACVGRAPIPFGVESIADAAFFRSGITQVVIPESVISIGASAFARSALRAALVPATVTTIEDGAFRLASSLTNVTFGSNSSLQSIGALAFEGTGLTVIEIPETVSSIGASAFQNIATLETVEFYPGTTLSTISDHMFRGTGLTSIEIPESVTAIGNHAFFDVSSLETLTFGGSSTLTSIGNRAFQGTAISTLSIPASVTSIGTGAFAFVPELTEVTFAESSALTTIGTSAFQGTGLESVILPASITSLGSSAFLNATNLENVTIPFSSTLSAINANVFRGTALTSFAIPSVVTSIGSFAFQGTALESIEIPTNVTRIGIGAFRNISTLTNVTFAGDFSNLSNLQTIGSTSFQNTGLSLVSIPASVTSLGASAFSGATGLDAVIFHGNAPTSVGVGPFANIAASAKLYITDIATGFSDPGDVWHGLPVTAVGGTYPCVDDEDLAVSGSGSITVSQFAVASNSGCTGLLTVPDGTLAIMENALSNAGISSAIIPSTVQTIGNAAFAVNTSLVSVSFTGTSRLRTIGNQAFLSNSSLASFVVPANVVSIGEAAFYPNAALTSVTFAGSSKLQTIGAAAFQQSGLRSITIPSNVISIGVNAFYGTASMKSVRFSGTSKLQTIGTSAFQASAIRSVRIPPSVTSIGSYAFHDLQSLRGISFSGTSKLQSIGEGTFQSSRAFTSITIPASVNSIGINAFYDASQLARVTFEGDAPATVGDNAFLGIGSGAAAHVLSTASGFGSEGDTWNGLTVVHVGGEYNCATDGATIGAGSFTVLNAVVTSSNNCAGRASIPYGVVAIGAGAFEDSNITSVVIPTSTKSIGADAFAGSEDLHSVTFSATSILESIGVGAFSDTGIISINLPPSLDSIGVDTFADSSDLESVTFVGDAPSQVGANAFSGVASSAIAFVTDVAEGFGADGAAWNGLIVEKVGGTYNCMTDGSASGSFTVSELVVTATSLCSGVAEIPDGVVTVGASAFQSSTASSVVIPSTVTAIGDYAFGNMSDLVSVTFTGNSRLQTIGNNAFQQNPALTSFTVPEFVTSIGQYAFWDTPTLTSVTFAGNSRLQSIALGAFQYSGLRAVTIPKNVTAIGNQAFFATSNLTTVNFAEGSVLQTIGDAAFQSSGVTSILIPSSVVLIEQNAFFGVNSLTRLRFATPSNLRTIGDAAFFATAMPSITIPATVTSIGDYAFQQISALTQVTFLGNAPNLDSYVFTYAGEGATAYVKDTATGFGSNGATWDALTVSTVGGSYDCTTDGATVGSGTFTVVDLVVTDSDGCVGRAEIPTGVISIGEEAFKNSGVVSAVIPSSVTTISADAFSGSESLESVVFTGRPVVETFGSSAFSNTELVSITVPSSVSTIGANAFKDSINLESIIFMGDAPSQVGSNAFQHVATAATAFVTNAASGFGVDGATWNLLMVDRIGGAYDCVTDGNTSGSGTFTVTNFVVTGHDNCTGRAQIPQGVIGIADGVIQYSAVTSVVIPESVTSIGAYAFYASSALASVTLYGNAPSGLGIFAAVPPNAKAFVMNTATGFGNTGDAWGGLTVTKVGGNYNCLNEGSTLGSGTFTVERFVITGSNDCTGRVEVPQGVISIAAGAFEDSGVVTASIAATVESIGADAFKSSTALTGITFLGNAPAQVGANAFSGLDSDVSAYQSEIASGFGDLGELWNGINVIRIGGAYACTTDGPTEGSGTFTVAQFVVTAHTSCVGRVEIPQAVTSIANNSLQSSSITSVVIPASVKSIGNEALYGVSSLTSVSFIGVSNLQTIGISAFREIGITSFSFPASVESIGDYAFYYNRSMTSITFANNSRLLNIGTASFSYSPLTAVTIPASVISVSGYAFYENVVLRSVKFEVGSALQTIGESAFRNTGIREITIPASVISIGIYAFSSSSLLSRLLFLGPVPETVGEGAFIGIAVGATVYSSGSGVGFGPSGGTWNDLAVVNVDGDYNCYEDGLEAGTFTVTGLTVVSNDSCVGFAEIPYGVYAIDDEAFMDSQVSEVSIPSSVASIGDDAFAGSTLLSSVKFVGNAPDAVGSDAFADIQAGASVLVSTSASGFGEDGSTWNNLTVVKVGGEYNCLTDGATVGAGTFTVADWVVTQSSGCFGRVEIPEGVTAIGTSAFESTWITSVLIASSVKSVGPQAFYLNDGLRSVEFTDSSNLEIIYENAFRQTSITSFRVPARVTTIGNSAFYFTNSLTTLTFASSSNLLSIGSTAFESTGLTSIKIPASVTTIGNSAFLNVLSLTSVSFGAGSNLQSIGANAFQSTAIEEVTIPSGVTEIGTYSFYAISGLQRVTFLGNAPVATAEGAFSGCGGCEVRVYVSATATGFAEAGEIWNQMTVVKVGGTYNCVTGEVSTGSFTVENLVVTSDESCSGTAEIPHGVYAIASEVFKNSSVASVTLPSTVLSVGDGAFSNADALTSITVASFNREFESVDGVLFDYGKAELVQYPAGKAQTTYTIPSGVQTIRSRAFEGAGNLTAVTIPVSVDSIGGSAFASASALTSITVAGANESFRAVDGVLFNFAQTELVQYPAGKSQTSYVIPVNVATIGAGAFKGATRLTTVTFPTSITGIGSSAFAQASSLVTLKYLPLAAPTVGTSSFAGVASSAKFYIKSTATGFTAAGTSWQGMTITHFFRITYNGNSNTSGSVPTDTSGFYVPNDSATVLSNSGNLRRTDYVFAGWNTLANGAGTDYAASGSATIKVTGNITLYAKWTLAPVKAVATVKPTITGTAQVGKKLTANKGTWTGTPAPTFAYQWYSCTKAITATTQTIPSTCTRISSATTTTLTLTTAMKGRFITVAVTGTSSGTTATVWLAKTTAAVK